MIDRFVGDFPEQQRPPGPDPEMSGGLPGVQESPVCQVSPSVSPLLPSLYPDFNKLYILFTLVYHSKEFKKKEVMLYTFFEFSCIFYGKNNQYILDNTLILFQNKLRTGCCVNFDTCTVGFC